MSKYKRNFITDVIFRIDFRNISGLNAGNQPEEFEEEIISKFPVKKPIEQRGLKLEGHGEGVSVEKMPTQTIWTYSDKEKRMIVELAANFLTVNCKKYETFDLFKKNVTSILDHFLSIYKIDSIDRMGLRYIDKITLDHDNLFSWKEHINIDLIKNLDFIGNKNTLRRIMQVYEIALKSDTNLRFQSGIFNSWYPDKLVQKEFYIDCDCYTPIQINANEIKEKIDDFHSLCSEYFEKSITEKFRKEILQYEK
jgi:uncharacterized protein (TIGR04255 family)